MVQSCLFPKSWVAFDVAKIIPVVWVWWKKSYWSPLHWARSRRLRGLFNTPQEGGEKTFCVFWVKQPFNTFSGLFRWSKTYQSLSATFFLQLKHRQKSRSSEGRRCLCHMTLITASYVCSYRGFMNHSGTQTEASWWLETRQLIKKSKDAVRLVWSCRTEMNQTWNVFEDISS